jgi:hypothetical protein
MIGAEHVTPRHECPERQPRCDAAIKQDNPDGQENESRGQILKLRTVTVEASATGIAAGYPAIFTPSVMQTLSDLAVKSTRDKDET